MLRGEGTEELECNISVHTDHLSCTGILVSSLLF